MDFLDDLALLGEIGVDTLGDLFRGDTGVETLGDLAALGDMGVDTLGDFSALGDTGVDTLGDLAPLGDIGVDTLGDLGLETADDRALPLGESVSEILSDFLDIRETLLDVFGELSSADNSKRSVSFIVRRDDLDILVLLIEIGLLAFSGVDKEDDLFDTTLLFLSGVVRDLDLLVETLSLIVSELILIGELFRLDLLDLFTIFFVLPT